MNDLYEIFRQRLAAGISSLHPHRWLAARAFGAIGSYVLDCNLQFSSLFALAEAEGSPLAVIGDAQIVDAQSGRRALRALGRQSLRNTYLANDRLSWSYRRHRPNGVSIQDALKDLLKERIATLRFEVRSPPGTADGVSTKAVYEVARFKAWKQGLGQLCAYARHFPKRRPILFLFGDQSRPARLEKIRGTCGFYGVRVEYMRFTADTFGSKANKSLLSCVAPPPEVHSCGGDRSNCLAAALAEASSVAHSRGADRPPVCRAGLISDTQTSDQQYLAKNPDVIAG